MLWLRLWLVLFLVLIFFLFLSWLLLLLLRLFLRLLLLRLLLLLRWDIRDRLLNELQLARNVGEDGLIPDRLIPAGDVRVRLAPFLVEEELEATTQDGGGEDVCEGKALADEVGVDQEMVLQDFESGLCGLHVVLDALLVVRIAADERTEPACEVREDLGVGEGAPAEDRCVVLLRLAEEGSFLVLRGDCDLYQWLLQRMANTRS